MGWINIKSTNKVVQEDRALHFAFEPIATLHERSEEIKDDISRVPLKILKPLYTIHITYYCSPWLALIIST
jgi:hypothetical protein